MKQGKLVSGLFFILILTVVGYMAYYIFQAMSAPFKTAEAVLYTAEETVSVNGWFLRDELLIPAGEGQVQEIRISEGEKVGKGEVLSVGYDNTEVHEVRSHLEDVEEQLALLKEAADGGNASDITKLDQSITEHLVNLIYSVEQPKAVDAAYESNRLKAAVLKRGLTYSDSGGQEASAAIAELTKQQKELAAQASGGSASVRAPCSGFFTSSVDGYENALTLEKADSLTLDELHGMETLKSAFAADGYCGRIATGFEWRFAAAVTSKYAKQLKEGSFITLRFTGDYIGEIKVKVRRVGDDKSEETVVVFSSNTMIGDLLSLRYQNADIVFSTYEGVRIPKEALRINDEGQTGVYCIVAMQAQFYPVEQIYETDHHYIVRYDPSSESGIRPGDTIIVSSKNLYDGKIVQ